MLVRICDRCGRSIPFPNPNAPDRELIINKRGKQIKNTTPLAFCDNCYLDLVVWFNHGKNKEKNI